MNIRKIKYCAAVAIITVATAFCGCDDKDKEIIEIENAGNADNSGNADASKMHGQEGGLTADRHSGADYTEKDPGTVKVYVCGAVRHPDVYELSREDRMMDAVEAAGGFESSAAKEYLNLAATLSDGEKIYIPTNAEIEEAMEEGLELYGATVNITTNSPGISTAGSEPNTALTGTTNAAGLVNINAADKATLMTLPGIGESKADKIIDYRQKNGGFGSIEDIMLVGGIKEGLYNKVKDKICVD